MSNTIVVGISGAPVTERVVDWAIARAKVRRQPIELVSVVGGAIGAVGEADVMLSAIDATRQLLDREAARVEAAGVPVTTRVESGNPVSVLVDASGNAALLVIGSDYRGPGEGPARGAHGIRIAAAAHSPVVVVPDIDLGDQRSGVVVGIDGSEISEPALKFAAAEADRLGEPLIAVSVWTPLVAPRNDLAVYPELYITNMQQATEEILSLALAGLASDYPDLQVIRKVEQGYPSHVINELAADARMTVVGTRGRGTFARLLLGSISHEVLARLAAVTAVVR
ncbi:universal stress protein [Microbacterium sp. MC2]